MKVQLSAVVTNKPSFKSIGKTQATFQTSTTTYNATNVTYSSSSTKYGGSDRMQDTGPQLSTVSEI